jgi:RNA polymerase sigma factor (sigma-70 family)
MPTNRVSKVVQDLRRAAFLRAGAGLTDGELLECFISRHEEAAVEELVRRHGPMVWGVCRRILRNYHDAEDAFQATFLVLVRKAASIVPRDMVANWLYGVAHQTALRARALVARRKGRERQVVKMPEPEVVEPDLWRDLQPLLDRELSALPDIYRITIVLCDLEGKTRKEAAHQLGVPEGTVAGRLARARAMLARRLTRHGLALSGGSLAVVLAQKAAAAALPASVLGSTVKAASLLAAGKAATEVIPAQVAILAESVLKGMLLAKLRTALAVILALVLFSGVGVLAFVQLGSRPKAANPQARPKGAIPAKAAKQGARPKPAAPDPEREITTAWGKEDHGLQAGIRFPAGKTMFRVGETLSFEVVIRNISANRIHFFYLSPSSWTAQLRPGRQLVLAPLLEVDGDGPHPHTPIIEAGKEWQAKPNLISVRTRLSKAGTAGGPRLTIAPGKYQVFCPNILLRWEKDQTPRQLPTGFLNLEILPAGKSDPPKSN